MTLQFDSGDSTLADLRQGMLRQELLLLEQRATARLLPHDPTLTEAASTWRDESPVNRSNPYWIWVTQVDGEMAWSGSIYVE